MGLSGDESIRQFFRAQNYDESDHISAVEFNQMFSGNLSGMGRKELE
jgi:hypothetical protein